MKKQILAGVLAGASLLSTSVSAFAAADKNPLQPDATKDIGSIAAVTETKYSVAVGALDVPLNVTIPKKMIAYLNPYGAAVKVDNDAASTAIDDGVVSWNYEIINKTKDFGINVDIIGANATVTKGIKMATAADLPDIAGGEKMMVGTIEEKKVFLALLASAPGDPTTWLDVNQSLVNTKGNEFGETPCASAYIFKTGATTKDVENFTKFAYVPASDGTTPQTTALAFRGNLSLNTQADGKGTDITWTKSDKVTAAFSLKFAPSSAGTGAGGPGAASFPSSLAAALADTDFTGTGITSVTCTASNVTVAVDSGTNGGSAVGLNLTGKVAAGITSITTKNTASGGTATIQVAGMGLNVNVTPQGTGTDTVNVVFNDGSTLDIEYVIS